jgi:long-chain acyl-CoA synthetase
MTRARPWLDLYPDGLAADARPAADTDALAMFEQTLAKNPESVAVWYFDTRITFAMLDEWSSAFAVALSEAGVRKGDRVAAQLQNVPQMVITILAVWKVGGIVVPTSAMAKGKELVHVLTDSGAVVIVAQESIWLDAVKPLIAETSIRTVITTSELDFVHDADTPAPLRMSHRERDPTTLDLADLLSTYAGGTVSRIHAAAIDPAFLTYTSGTTGPAKGAINTHGNVVFNSQIYQEWVPLSRDDVILGIAPLFHVTGLIGHITVSFLTGAPLVLAYRFDPPTMLRLLERHRATFTVGAITAFISMMNVPEIERFDVSSLSKILSGGAPIAPSVASEVKRVFGAPLRNVYGLTETTSPSHITPAGLHAPVDARSGALSVGVPVTATHASIVDDAGRRLPPGELGEITISGPQVVPGYWGKPEETAHALPGGVLHTGDIGLMDDAGWFFVVDRLKDQINTSGFKVWPRDVEDVLLAHPAVREAAVVGVRDDYRGETVKAFVAVRPAAEVSPNELIAFCRERMAAYKCPRMVELVAELPKTASGKILRRELRESS